MEETNREDYMPPVTHKAHSHDMRESDYYPSQVVSPFVKERLDGLVSTANQYRTKACGMMNQVDRSIHPRTKAKSKKAPGSSVTQDDINTQRNNRRRAHRKPPVPKMKKDLDKSGDGNSNLGISVNHSGFQTNSTRKVYSMTPQEASCPNNYLRSSENKENRKTHVYATLRSPPEVAADLVSPH